MLLAQEDVNEIGRQTSLLAKQNDPLVKGGFGSQSELLNMKTGGLAGLMQAEEVKVEQDKETLSSIEFMKRTVEVLNARVDQVER